MALSALAEEYFRDMSPLASKIHEDITETKNAYESMWDTLSEKEKVEIINESIIKPEIALKYALLDTLDFDINDPPVRKDDLMSFFGRDHGQRIVQDENGKWRDEHSAPFLYQTKSQLNLCALSEHRGKNLYNDKNVKSGDELAPEISELAMSHSKVVCELKNALKSHDVLKSTNYNKEKPDDSIISSPTSFISKFMGTFKNKDEESERLVSSDLQSFMSTDNFFSSVFKSPPVESKFDKEYRNSIVKSNSDLSEENRGLLSNISQGSSGTDFHSCEASPEQTRKPATSRVSRVGFEFLDNW